MPVVSKNKSIKIKTHRYGSSPAEEPVLLGSVQLSYEPPAPPLCPGPLQPMCPHSLLLPGLGREDVLLLFRVEPVHLVDGVHDLHAVVHLPAPVRDRRLTGARRAAGRHRRDAAATCRKLPQAAVMLLTNRGLAKSVEPRL